MLGGKADRSVISAEDTSALSELQVALIALQTLTHTSDPRLRVVFSPHVTASPSATQVSRN